VVAAWSTSPSSVWHGGPFLDVPHSLLGGVTGAEAVRPSAHTLFVGEARLIEQAYRFELDPSAEQAVFLGACCGAARFWFNQALDEVKRRLDLRAAGEEVSVPWSYHQLCSEFDRDWRAERCGWQHEVVCGCYQGGFQSLGLALKNFSDGRRAGRRVGFPSFRRKGGAHTESVIFQRAKPVDARRVQLDGRIGPVRSKERMSKMIGLLGRDEHARILRATLSRKGGRWFISFTVRRSSKRRRARRPQAVAGMDPGLRRLATLSTGEAFANARPLAGALRRLRRVERRLDRQRRASNPGNYLSDGRPKPGARNWVKSKRMLRVEAQRRRLHERVAHLRREQSHQLTTYLTREFGVIGVETLAVKNLMGNRRLARHIADAGWRLILQQLKYKTSWSDGSLLVAADRFYPSSKTCSGCGTVRAKLALSERVFSCEACGLVLDRDVNAALNLARMAQRHAQAEGISKCYVARTGRETLNARGGQVRPGTHAGLGPLKREASSEATQAREGLALAA
jgi:putative transposase